MTEQTARALTSIQVDDELLRGWPLPDPDEASDKDGRGRVLLIGGSPEMPGAIILAALAAMRGGAGKLCIATARSVAAYVAATVPEARVIALDETVDGGLKVPANGTLPLAGVDAVLIGPGMQDVSATCSLAQCVVAACGNAQVVLDALAMNYLHVRAQEGIAPQQLARPPAHDGIVITPHAGELASLLELSKEEIERDPRNAAFRAAAKWRVLVAGKGKATHIVDPSGTHWCHAGGNVGLATSGSGDVLAGLLCGLCARGASLEQATVWAVRLHARAGDMLQRRHGRVGYLARELPDVIPSLMEEFSQSQ